MARRSRTRARPQATTPRVVLDSGAVLALARRQQRALAFLAVAYEQDAFVVVPAVVVAETTRGSGPRDAAVNRLLNTVGEISPPTDMTARVAGRLLAVARSAATIDALVVADALRAGGGRILTTDVDDLRSLASDHPEVAIHAV
jgi:predicted nucleic acid-binding protein